LAGIVQGPSSSGKSYVIDKTAALFPPEAIIRATQMTPQALFHMPPGSLVHRFIVAGERSRQENDDTAEATRALREMISAGKLSKLMPVKVGGEIVTQVIEQDGPVAYVESTTLAKIFEEDANRCILFHTDEQPKQTRKILTKLAAGYGRATIQADTDLIIQRHHALQRMLKQMPAVIPYADRLGELFTSERVEVRRAFPQLMSMVQAIVLLYQRQRKLDDHGQLIAAADDYQLARHLLHEPMARLLGGKLSEPALRFYNRLSTWAMDSFTTSDAKQHETNSKSAVYSWIMELYDAGYLAMVEASRGRNPATWKRTGVTPDNNLDVALPTMEQVFSQPTWKHGHNAQPDIQP
jgi:hypothetical protein